MDNSAEIREARGLSDYVNLSDHTFREENLHMYTPTPFYEEYSMSGIYEEDVEDERDINYFKSLYPQSAVQVLEHIEEECDKMEHEGSRMFDEHPDRWMIREVEERIYIKVQEQTREDETEAEKQDISVEATGYGPGYGPGWGPGYGPQGGFLGDMIHVLLYDEMYRRRCRYRRCRRRYYEKASE